MPVYKPKFKAQVALYTLENKLSYSQIADQFSIPKGLVGTWVRKLREESYLIFEDQRALNRGQRLTKLMERCRNERRKGR